MPATGEQRGDRLAVAQKPPRAKLPTVANVKDKMPTSRAQSTLAAPLRRVSRCPQPPTRLVDPPFRPPLLSVPCRRCTTSGRHLIRLLSTTLSFRREFRYPAKLSLYCTAPSMLLTIRASTCRIRPEQGVFVRGLHVLHAKIHCFHPKVLVRLPISSTLHLSPTPDRRQQG